MNLSQIYKQDKAAQEYKFEFIGKAGKLEAILIWPAQPVASYIAVLGHPHSLYGGSMQNKVITTLARAFRDLNIPSLRFNFRGVGLSEGVFDAGIGEADDMLELMQLWSKEEPDAKFILGGFSFGSFVAYRAACQVKSELLLSIAPPVHHFDFQSCEVKAPWLIFQGDADEVVPVNLVLDFADKLSLPVIRFAETSHFFHGKLLELKSALEASIQPYLSK